MTIRVKHVPAMAAAVALPGRLWRGRREQDERRPRQSEVVRAGRGG